MNCRENESLILAERDGALTDGQHAALSGHLAACPACRKMRTDLAAAVDAYRNAINEIAVPDADDAWRDLQTRLREPTNRSKRTRLAPVIWFGAPLAAAAALVFSFVLARQPPPTSSPAVEMVVVPPPPPLHDPSIIAGADFVEAGDPNASTLVYVDKESGWLVVWATAGSADNSG